MFSQFSDLLEKIEQGRRLTIEEAQLLDGIFNYMWWYLEVADMKNGTGYFSTRQGFQTNFANFKTYNLSFATVVLKTVLINSFTKM